MTGPGRPTTGTRVQVRIPADLLATIDTEAAELGVPRAEVIRRRLSEDRDAARANQ